jgi:hypothetical protein
MKFFLGRVALAGALLGLLIGCSRSSSSSGRSSAAVGATNSKATNLGLAAVGMLGKGRLWLVAASERGQGVDLDGDGDILGPVLHLYDSFQGDLQNLALALAGLPAYEPGLVDDGRAVFPVAEYAQGLDANGDGDASDLVLHLFDVRQPAIENLGLAIPAGLPFVVRLEGDLLLMGVDEASQGIDLDDDGLLDGEVIYVRDFARGVTRSLGRRMVARTLHAVDRRAAFLITETVATGDLNGDGDTNDTSVLVIYDGSRGVLVSSGLATAGERVLFAADFASALVSEEQQGVDLDGDGDLLDFVFHDFDPLTGSMRNLGLEGAPVPSTEGPDVLALMVAESATSGDLDGDGDETDVVPFLYDPVLGQSTNLGLAHSTASAPIFLERSLVMIVSEADQGGVDLDGDGDADGLVPHVYDLVNGTTTNLALDGAAFGAAQGYLLIGRLEAGARVDWNGDGDRTDSVLFAWDEQRDQLVNTRMSAISLLDARVDRVLLLQSESRDGRDLNGDGDELDRVIASYDFGTGLRARTALAGRRGSLVGPDAALVFVDEVSQGLDLNGDGDKLDSVLHRVDFRQ